MDKQRKEIEHTLNLLWQMHDEAEGSGNKDLAADYASRAFQLLENLPENAVYLRTKQ